MTITMTKTRGQGKKYHALPLPSYLLPSLKTNHRSNIHFSRTSQYGHKGANLSFVGVGLKIVQKESPLALYKGLGAVTAGIVPKMAIRFTTFQFYKDLMVDKNGTPWKLNNLWGKFCHVTIAKARCCTFYPRECRNYTMRSIKKKNLQLIAYT